MSYGMKLFYAMLIALGISTHAGCWKPLDVAPNVCYVVRAYRADHSWAVMDYYRITDTSYQFMWTVRR